MGFSLKKITKKISNKFNNILSSPVGGIVDAFVGTNFYGSAQQQKQNEQAFQQQRQLINEQNLYNSPQSQMQRLASAGLNPNLLYGQISSGNQSQIAQPSDYSSSNNRFLSSIGKRLQDIYYANANLDLQNKRLANESLHLDNESKRLSMLESVEGFKENNMQYQNALNALKLRRDSQFFGSTGLMNLYDYGKNAYNYLSNPSGRQRVLSSLKKIYSFFRK